MENVRAGYLEEKTHAKFCYQNHFVLQICSTYKNPQHFHKNAVYCQDIKAGVLWAAIYEKKERKMQNVDWNAISLKTLVPEKDSAKFHLDLTFVKINSTGTFFSQKLLPLRQPNYLNIGNILTKL